LRQRAVSGRRRCIEASAEIRAGDRFRHTASDRPATALAIKRDITPTDCKSPASKQTL
jgi:hypothetical protein